MHADEICDAASDKNGLIIIGIAPTGQDHACAIRIWGLLDDVMAELGKELGLGPIPNPQCKRAGDSWITLHPGLRYDTPVRNPSKDKNKAFKDETPAEVQERIAQNRKKNVPKK